MNSDLSEYSINKENNTSLVESGCSDSADKGEGCSQILYDAAFYMVYSPFLLLI